MSYFIDITRRAILFSSRMSESTDVLGFGESSFQSLGLRHFGRLSLPKNVDYYGYAITCSFVAIGIVYLYTAFVSKLLPDTGYFLLDFFKYDYYFCFLIPLSIIPTYMVIYLNWLAMRHFEQN